MTDDKPSYVDRLKARIAELEAANAEQARIIGDATEDSAAFAQGVVEGRRQLCEELARQMNRDPGMRAAGLQFKPGDMQQSLYNQGVAAGKLLKLFVWRNVLIDYTDGLAVAMAATAEEAIELLRKDGLYESKIDGTRIEGEDGWQEPEVYDVPAAAWVYGGG